MRFGVLQKGLIIVAIPVVLEIILVSVLGFLLYRSDRLFEEETEHCKLAMDGARLAFANCNAGAAIVQAWQAHDISRLSFFEMECDRIKVLAKRVRSYKPDDNQTTSDEIMDAQEAVMKQLRSFADALSEGGFGFDSFRNLMEGQKKLRKDLTRIMSLLKKRYSDIDKGLPAEWRRMQELQDATVYTLEAGIALNILVAGSMLIYFRRSFVIPMDRIKQNLDLMAQKQALLPPLPHTDEIAELDRTLHSMVHELEASKEREQALFRNSSDVICIISPQLFIHSINPASQRVWGIAPEQAIGNSIAYFVAPEDLEQVRIKIEEARQDRKPASFSSRLKIGQKQIDSVWSVFWSPDGEAGHCVIHDVSDAKELERQREAYMRIIASDFRKPLSRMNGLVDSLVHGTDGTLPEQASKKISGAADTLGRMVSLVDELIDLETLKNAEIKLNRKDIPARQLLEAALKDTESLANSKQVQLSIDCPEDLHCAADSDRIVRVLVNFISNAIKFSPAGSKVKIKASNNCVPSHAQQEAPEGVAISLAEPCAVPAGGAGASLAEAAKMAASSSDLAAGLVSSPSIRAGKSEHLSSAAILPTRADPASARLSSAGSARAGSPELIRFEVVDTGRGIPDDARAKLFQPYQQVESSDGKRGKGTGLGLVVCKRVVEQHGGEIGVRSKEGEGSNFWFTLPVDESIPRLPEATLASPVQQTMVIPQALLNFQQSPILANISIKKKGLLLIVLPLLFQCAFIGLMMTWLTESGKGLEKEIHNRDLARSASHVSMSFFDIMVALRRQPLSKEDIQEALDQLPQRVSRLVQATEHDPVAERFAQPVLTYIDNTVLTVTNKLNRIVKRHQENNLKLLERYSNGMVLISAELGRQVEMMINAVDRSNKENPERLTQLRRTQAYTLAAALLANVVIALWLATYFSKDVIRRLLIMSDNSRRLALAQPLNPVLQGSDEIALLDQAFHSTAAKLEELRARESAFLDNAQNLIAAFDANGNFESVNRASSAFLGGSSREIVGQNISAFLGSTENETWKNCLKLARDSKDPVTFQITMNPGEGSIDLSWSILWSDSEQLFYGVAYDITQEKNLERMKREFMALITHDLRTPLTTIQGLSIILQTGALGALPSSANEKLKQIKDESDHILELVNDLLDMSKLESGQTQLELQHLSLQRILTLIETQLKVLGFTLVVNAKDTEAGGETFVEADLDRLPFAVTSLLMECFTAKSAHVEVRANPENIQLKFTGLSAEKDIDKRIDAQDNGMLSIGSSRRFRLSIAKSLLALHKVPHGARWIDSELSNDISTEDSNQQNLELTLTLVRSAKIAQV